MSYLPETQVVELTARVAELETECSELRKELSYAENRLEFERHCFRRQMEMKEAGIAEELAKMLALELLGIREIADHVGENDRRRILRRLQRIDRILGDFGRVEHETA